MMNQKEYSLIFAMCILVLLLCARCHAVEGKSRTTKVIPEHYDNQGQPTEKSPPNILFVLIDDLGWGDVGFHQSSEKYEQFRLDPREIQTPVMDELVQQGLELRRHYVHRTCTGTRTALQSGRFPVHVQTSLKFPEDPSSGMPRNLTGLAEHLKHSNHNYSTHYVGKWDAGMASPKHTPQGRGYDTSLNYFEHKNDFWTQECAQSKCCRQLLLQQQLENEGATSDAKDSNVSYAIDAKRKRKPELVKDLWDTDRPARDLVGTDYEEFIFQRRLLEIIDNHAKQNNLEANHTSQQQQQQQKQSTSSSPTKPLFLFYAPHVAHCPLQVPQSYLDQFSFMENDEDMCQAETANILRPDAKTQPPYSCRKQYRAMVKLLDDILGTLVERLKFHGMWDNTLMVVTSDNGGPVRLTESGATNYPLRGGKYSDWEGGVRATAFVSGGYIPPNRRGGVVHDPIHICDWYATLPALAGVNVREREKITSSHLTSNVPPVDAVDIWPLIVGNDNSQNKENDKDDITVSQLRSKRPDPEPPRVEIPLSAHALIIGEYKLLWNEQANISIAGWTDPDYPNGQTPPEGINKEYMDCSDGCLFNVHKDPGEHVNIAAIEPVRVQQMKNRLEILRKGFFENDDRGVDSCPKGYDIGYNEDDPLPCACWMAVNYYGGFLGPYQEVDVPPNLAISTDTR